MRNPALAPVVLALLLVPGSLPAMAEEAADSRQDQPATLPSAQAEHSFAEIVEIAPQLLMVVGRAMDLARGEIDVANALLYRTGDSLVVVDTGGTEAFRQALDRAAASLRPFQDVLLVNTHGHPDHVGNNGWIESLGLPFRHLVSAHDLVLMRDPVPGFASDFDRASPYLEQPIQGEQFARKIVDLFGKLQVDTAELTLLESLPPESILIGGTSWDGWQLLDGKVAVLRTGGHTHGHVAVYLPEHALLHLADETTSYYQAFSDAAPLSNLRTLQRALQAVRSGAVAVVTDGHSFRVHRGTEAETYLARLLEASLAYGRAVSRVLNQAPDGLTLGELVDKVERAPEMADAPSGANDMTFFSYLQMMNKLSELAIAAPETPEARLHWPQ